MPEISRHVEVVPSIFALGRRSDAAHWSTFCSPTNRRKRETPLFWSKYSTRMVHQPGAPR